MRRLSRSRSARVVQRPDDAEQRERGEHEHAAGAQAVACIIGGEQDGRVPRRPDRAEHQRGPHGREAILKARQGEAAPPGLFVSAEEQRCQEQRG